MYLSDSDLEQLDEARLSELTAVQKETLLKKAVSDLKEARERLKADSRTRSRPPSSDTPWSNGAVEDSASGDESKPAEAAVEAGEPEAADQEAAAEKPTDQASPKRPGRRKGSPGHSRTEKLAITETIEHAPERCALCERELSDQPFEARTGLYVLDLDATNETG